MNLTDDFTLKCLLGYPVLFEDICAIYPAKIGEIVAVGYDKFLLYIHYILIEKPTDTGNKQINELIDDLTPFQYLIMMASMDFEANLQIREAFKFFTHDDVSFSLNPPQIIIGPLDEQHIIDEEHFLEFRRIIRKMYFMDTQEEIVQKKEDNPFVAAIKKKMLKNREMLAKAKKVSKNDKSDMNFSDLIASIAIAQCGLNIITVKEMTYYAFHDQLKRLGWRDKFNINNRAALAGAKLKKSELKHWMRPIDSKDNKN